MSEIETRELRPAGKNHAGLFTVRVFGNDRVSL